MVQTNCPLSSLHVCFGGDKNKAAREEAAKRHSDRVYAHRSKGNKLYNAETNFKRKSHFIQGIGESRTLSDIREKIMQKRASGLKGKENLARQYATTQYVNEGSGARTAGRNKYLELLGQQANIDNRISQLAGRGEAKLQEGWKRQRAGLLTAEYNTVADINTGFGPPELMPPKKRGNIFMGLLSIGMSLAGTGIFGSDEKLKKNIERVDTSNDGYPIYEFSYLGSRKRYRGVMAQDVVKTNPMAVHIQNGLMYVDYSKLDVDMELVS